MKQCVIRAGNEITIKTQSTNFEQLNKLNNPINAQIFVVYGQRVF